MLCERCEYELYGRCYERRTIWQQIEQRGGRIMSPTIKTCPRFNPTTEERKKSIRRQAEWKVREKEKEDDI